MLLSEKPILYETQRAGGSELNEEHPKSIQKSLHLANFGHWSRLYSLCGAYQLVQNF